MATLVHYTFTVPLSGLVDLVCFSRVTFGPMKGERYMEGLKFIPSIGIHPKSIMPFKHAWAYGWHFWDS